LNNPIGVLLLNLGTPDNCSVTAVAKYLNQFLSDPRVIELPAILRWLLVKFIIVPFRSAKSAHAYREIWQADGSPLLINSELLRTVLAEKLNSDDNKNYIVTLGMRYGKPDINTALRQLEKLAVEKIIVIPLFPQYSSAATGSALEQVLQIIAKFKVIPEIAVITAYFQNADFIQALTNSIQPYITSDFEYLLMSYHGLPERQMLHSGCYKTQCLQTSNLVAKSLNLAESAWGYSFQSRLGRLPWIRPYTDEVLIELRQRGIKNLVICCPSFVVDCLETLEEIGMRALQQWQVLGGQTLTLVPCLNAQPSWVNALEAMVLKASP